jgi:hypothetical protein
MTIQGWEQVKELLHQAMQLAPEQRAQFLDKPCSSDIALRAEVESLLLAGEYVHSGSCNRHRCAPIQIAPTRSLPWNRDRSSPSISNLSASLAKEEWDKSGWPNRPLPCDGKSRSS